MSDSPDLSKRLAPGRLTPDVAAAHQRLASLPTLRYSREDAANVARARKAVELSETLRRARLNSGATYNTAPDNFGQRRSRKGIKGGTHKGRRYKTD